MGNCSPHPVIETPCTPSYYDVYNVDAKLFKHSKGKIQITNEDLILYYKNVLDAEPIRWPLKGLRRYGYHKDIFLFECGRRCPTGEGLFAFKCSKAKRLNDSLQKAILNSSTTLVDWKQNQHVTVRDNKHKKINTVISNRYNIKRTSSTDKENSTSTTTSKAPYLKPINQKPVNFDNIDSTEVFNSPDSHQIETSTPYYVNNNNNIVRLPLSLSFVTPNDKNAFPNNEQIDPCIIHIVKNGLNGINPNNSNQNVKQSSSSSASSSSSYSSSSNHSINLIYVVPERMNENKRSNISSLVDDSSHSKHASDSNSNQRSGSSNNDETSKAVSKRSRNEISSLNSSQIEYSIIDPDKGLAMQESQKQNQNKRKEYSIINYK